MQSRRKFIQNSGLLSAGILLSRVKGYSLNYTEYETKRPLVVDRKFASEAVEAAIVKIKKQIADPELAWLFENCFPNTLDTTVDFEMINGQPDTYVITGDIDAMWL